MRERMDAERLAELGERFSAARAALIGEQPDDMTREQLLQQARNVDLEGASGMGKDELQRELRREAEL
jgi:hypothetical protein